ncbi:uncharacterized protein LOC142180391 [Nicotiana tabacum]|uniref:Uncharacterized protein LOC142180391 n=1 Tax=Nicotiana tabacum TaxID=4097 RepID=A0AC58UGU3_TOBAC
MIDKVDIIFNYGGDWVISPVSEFTVNAQDTTYHTETYGVDVEVASDCEHSLGSYDFSESDCNGYDYEELESINKQRRRVVSDRLENFKELELGMTFKDMKEARQFINFYALANKKGLWVVKSDSTRSKYKYDTGCPFVCLISQNGRTVGYKIKTLNPNHNCNPCFKNKRASAKTLAQYFKNKVQDNPKYKVKDMRGELDTDLSLNVTKSTLKRAKRLALEKLEGSFLDDYNKLEAYGQEIKHSNPGSDVVINISNDALAEGKRRFLRMYICFQAMKHGWKDVLRPLIGLDGTFLKGKCKGQLLVAIGQDCMNQFYPLAWAVVDKDSSRTWS